MAKTTVKDNTGFKTKSVKNTNYSRAKVSYSAHKAKPKDFLPFRVKFINIGLESYTANNPAPIGIAVIGINNYIL